MEKHHNTLAGMEVPPQSIPDLSSQLIGLAIAQGKSPALPLHPEEAAAAVLSRLSSGSWQATAESFDVLNGWVTGLETQDPAIIRKELAIQCAILNQVFLACTAKGAGGGNKASDMLRTGIAAQQALARTLALIGSMAETPVK